MKKLILWAIALIALAACQQQTKQYFTSSPEIDLVKKGNAAYVSGDWAALRSLFADTASIADNTWVESEFLAPDAFIKRLAWDSVFSSVKIGDDAIYEMVITDNGEKWVHNWFNWTATLKNGKEVNTPIHLVFRFVDNMVVFHGAIYNQLPVYMAMEPDSTITK